MRVNRIIEAWKGPSECAACGIRHLALFCDLQEQDFVHLHQPIEDQEFSAGETLYGVGDPGQAVFTVRSGLIKLIQYLPNGNYLIQVGRTGYAFELTPDQEIVWEYKTPLNGGARASQGDVLSENNNLTFRMDRYPAEYAAFEGRDLSSQGWIELNPDSTFCEQILPAGEQFSSYGLKAYPNPAASQLVLEWEGGVWAEFEVFDLWGRQLERFRATGGRKYMDISDWREGVYFVRVNGMDVRKVVVRR